MVSCLGLSLAVLLSALSTSVYKATVHIVGINTRWGEPSYLKVSLAFGVAHITSVNITAEIMNFLENSSVYPLSRTAEDIVVDTISPRAVASVAEEVEPTIMPTPTIVINCLPSRGFVQPLPSWSAPVVTSREPGNVYDVGAIDNRRHSGYLRRGA